MCALVTGVQTCALPIYDEISQIHDAIGRSVPNWWSITHDKISSGQLTSADLTPQRAEYFTTLCGPFPNGLGVDEYVLGLLADHRRMLIAKDLQIGRAHV